MREDFGRALDVIAERLQKIETDIVALKAQVRALEARPLPPLAISSPDHTAARKNSDDQPVKTDPIADPPPE